jgi:hypothetical protein
LVALIGRVVDNSVHLVTLLRIDICQQPVAGNVSLNPPSQRKLSLGLDVDQTRLGLLQASAGRLDSEGLRLGLGLGLRRLNRHGELQNLDSGLKSHNRVGSVTLSVLWRRGNVALEEGVSEREDLSIPTNLLTVKERSSVDIAYETIVSSSENTHVDVEISIVDVEPVCGLLEVEVSNTVVSDVVVVDKAELRTGSLALDKLRGGLLSGCASPQGRNSRVCVNLGSVLVFRLDDHAEGIQVDGSAVERPRAMAGRMSMDSSQRSQRGNDSSPHIGNEWR